MAGRVFSAISRYLKATAVVKIDYCYWQACLKNTVGYALRIFSSGSGESHPNRYETVKVFNLKDLTTKDTKNTKL